MMQFREPPYLCLKFTPSDADVFNKFLGPHIRRDLDQTTCLVFPGIVYGVPPEQVDLSAFANSQYHHPYNFWYFGSRVPKRIGSMEPLRTIADFGVWKKKGKPVMVVDPSTSMVLGTKQQLLFSYTNQEDVRGLKSGWEMFEFVPAIRPQPAGHPAIPRVFQEKVVVNLIYKSEDDAIRHAGLAHPHYVPIPIPIPDPPVRRVGRIRGRGRRREGGQREVVGRNQIEGVLPEVQRNQPEVSLSEDQQFNDVSQGLGNQTRGLDRHQGNQPEEVLLEVHRDSLQFSRTQQFNDVTQGLGTLGELGNVGGVLNDGTGTLVFNHGTQGDIQGLENQTRGLDRHQRNQLEEVLPEVHRDSLQFSQNQQFNVHTQGLGTLGGLGNVGGVLNDGTGTGTLVFNHGTQGDTQDQQFNDVTLGLGNQTRGLDRQQRNQPGVLPEVHRDSLQFSHDDDLYVFNDLGNLGELGNLQGVFNNNDSTLVDNHGSLVFHDDVTLVFDNEGNLVDTLVFNDDGTLVDPFVFNDDGTLVDPLVFEEDGTLALNNDGTQGVVTQGDGTQGNGTQGDGIQGDGTQGVFKDGFHLRSLYGQGDEDI